jgi:hypothetical protein
LMNSIESCKNIKGKYFTLYLTYHSATPLAKGYAPSCTCKRLIITQSRSSKLYLSIHKKEKLSFVDELVL